MFYNQACYKNKDDTLYLHQCLSLSGKLETSNQKLILPSDIWLNLFSVISVIINEH